MGNFFLASVLGNLEARITKKIMVKSMALWDMNHLYIWKAKIQEAEAGGLRV